MVTPQPHLHSGLFLDSSEWPTLNPGDSGVPQGTGLRCPGQAWEMPKLWKCRPLFSQTFIQTLDFHQVKHSSEAKKEICASSFPLCCVIHPLPQSSRRLHIGPASLGQAGDSRRKNQQGTQTNKMSKYHPTPHTGLSTSESGMLPSNASRFHTDPGFLFSKSLRPVPFSRLAAAMGIV